jgi:hypothetical protein
MWAIAAGIGSAPLGLKGINPSGDGWASLANLSSNALAAVVSDFQGLGVQWVRWEMDANVIDPGCSSSGSAMNWGNNDAVITALHNAGIRIMALLNQASPCMNGAQGVQYGPTASAGRASWATFAGAVAQRYGAAGTSVPGGVQAYEIWNEPNCGIFWLPTDGNQAANYEPLIAAAYSALKNADRAATVVVGAMAQWCSTGGGLFSTHDFLADLYADGLHGSADALSTHPYCVSGGSPPTCRQVEEVYNSSGPNNYSATGAACAAASAGGTPGNCTLTNIAAQGGDAGIKFWFTEWGRGTTQNPLSSTGQPSGDQADQANDITAMFTLSSNSASSWAGPVFVYNYQDFVGESGTGPDGEPQCTASDDPHGTGCFGIELYGSSGVGGAKAAYAAFQAAPSR